MRPVEPARLSPVWVQCVQPQSRTTCCSTDVLISEPEHNGICRCKIPILTDKLCSVAQPKRLSNVVVQRPAIIKHADRRGRDPLGPKHWVRTVEQVAEGAPVMRVHPAPSSMLRTVMDHVAALAQRRQLVERAVAGIMVEVSAGQHHRRPGAESQDVFRGPSHASALAVAPAMPLPVPPSSIPQMEHPLPMRASTMLASAPCPHETHMVRELRPVDRV